MTPFPSPPEIPAERVNAANAAKAGTRRATARGSVTAELAVVLPAMTALLAVLLLGISAGMLQLRLEEGARAGARALARGDSSAQVLSTVSRVAGEGASVSMESSGGYVLVTVQGRVGGALSGLLPWTQTAQASARVESVEQRTNDQVPALQGPHVYKTSLWRWARAPGCPLSTGWCAAVVTDRTGGIHGQP